VPFELVPVRRRACRFLAAAALAAAAAPAGAQAPASAFAERSLHLLHVPFLFFGPADPAAPAPGELGASLEAAVASTFSSTWHALTLHRDAAGKSLAADEARAIHRQFPEDTVYYIESDLLRVALTPRVGLSPVLAVSAEIVWISHDAVRIGSALESVHRAFGFRQPGRREFPSDAFGVLLQRPEGALTFDDRTPPAGWGDTTATLSWRPARRSGWRFGADVAVKAPTGRAEDYCGSGSWDAGVLGFARRDGERWSWDAETGVVVPGRWRSSVGLPVAPYARLLLDATRSFGDRTRIGASATFEQSPFRATRWGTFRGQASSSGSGSSGISPLAGESGSR